MPGLEELPIPENVVAAQRKSEMARIWLADGYQVVVLSDRLWDDPGTWGLMLVDMARHVSKAYEVKGRNAADTLLNQGCDGRRMA